MDSQLIDPRVAYSMQGGRQDESLIRFQLDASEELEILKANLLGLSWSEDKADYVSDSTKEPMINKKGANILISFLQPRVSKIFSLSNHEQQDIDARCLQFINDLTFLLGKHMREWEIKSFAVADNIIDLCDDIFRATALKSREGWEGNGIRQQHTVHEGREIITETRPENRMPFQFPFKFGGGKQ